MNPKIFLERAENELELAKIIFKLSKEKDLQVNIFKTNSYLSFFSAVITHSYYSIFYTAKAYFASKNIFLSAPEEHKKTFKKFEEFTKKGILDSSLFVLYKEVFIKADVLLEIFRIEKKKRGTFTYQKMPQANELPALESLKNAKTFFKHVNLLIFKNT